MRKPDWFTLIQQWRLKRMGVYGVTLPFLVGALGYKAGKTKLGAQHVRDVLDDIIGHPVDGFVTEARWCGDVDAPVLTIAPMNNDPYRMPFRSFFPRPNAEGQSLVFSDDLQSMFGLDCKNAGECYEKLLSYAAKFVEKEQYSRIWNDSTGAYDYGSFSQKELDYVQATIMGP